MRTSVFLAAALAGATLLGAAPADKAKVGKVPQYKFEGPVANGAGVTSLESFRGKPVVVEFWGTY